MGHGSFCSNLHRTTEIRVFFIHHQELTFRSMTGFTCLEKPGDIIEKTGEKCRLTKRSLILFIYHDHDLNKVAVAKGGWIYCRGGKKYFYNKK